MSPARMKMPAAAPTAAPLASPVMFSVTSALASAISSRTSSEAVSETSLTRLGQIRCLMVRHASVDQPLEDAGEQERAGEDDPGRDLRAVERARLGRLRPRAARSAGGGGRGGRRIGVRTHARRHHVRAGEIRAAASDARGLRRRRSASAACLRPARPRPRPARHAPCALRSLRESFSSSLLGGLDVLVGLRRSPPRRAARRSRELGAQLGAACLGSARSACASASRAAAEPRLGGRRGRHARAPSSKRSSAGVPLLRALGVVFSHSGGSSPKMRRNTTAATRVGHDRGQGARCRPAGRTRPGA